MAIVSQHLEEHDGARHTVAQRRHPIGVRVDHRVQRFDVEPGAVPVGSARQRGRRSPQRSLDLADAIDVGVEPVAVRDSVGQVEGQSA